MIADRKSSKLELYVAGGQLVFISDDMEMYTFTKCSRAKPWELCLQFLDDNNKYYTRKMLNSTEEPILGRNKWKRQDDELIEITLTLCNSTSFTCDSGQCIHLYKRCDSSRNCKDGSDEGTSCDVKPLIPVTYFKYECPTDENSPVVSLNITSFGVSDVEMNQNRVNIMLEITLMWVDPRITFRDLNPGYVYAIPIETLTKLWRPNLVIVEGSYLDNLRLNDRTLLREKLFLISSSRGDRKVYKSRESKYKSQNLSELQMCSFEFIPVDMIYF